MRIVFMGTPDFAVPALMELVAAGHDVLCVYTQPPRPRGRGHKMQPSPVGALAADYGIDVRTPDSLKPEEEADALAALEPDVAVVVAYGQILPKKILSIPAYGCLNLHASLLPRWRGAAPIQRAIMAGDKLSGVQVMQMEAGLDTGPILLSETVPIEPDETYQSLHDKLAPIGAGLLPRALAALERGGLVPTEQSEEGVTYAHKISPEDARIDWSRPAAEIDQQIRGLSPFPGAYTEHEGTRLKLLGSRKTEDRGAPGAVIDAADGRLFIAAGDGRSVEITKLQRPGKAAQPTEEFLRGYSFPQNAVLS